MGAAGVSGRARTLVVQAGRAVTVAFWLATGQTVVFLALCGWAFWTTGRIADLLNAADIIRAHSECGAQRATRAALDARAMLEQLRDESAVLRDWWHAHSDPDPVTEPMRRIGTDTAQAPAIAEFGPTPPGDDRVHDAGMAEVLAYADQDLIDMRARWAADDAAAEQEAAT